MDDLADLDWQSSKPTASQKLSNANYYPTLRPTPPISGASTPANGSLFVPPRPSSTNPPRSNSSTPANDSFANLVAFRSGQSTSANLSLQEQQRRLEEEKFKQSKQLHTSNIGSANDDGAFWEKLGSGRSTPNPLTSPPAYAASSEYGGHKLSAAVNKRFEGINGSARSTGGGEVVTGEEDLLGGLGGSSSRQTVVSGRRELASTASAYRAQGQSVGSPAAVVDQNRSQLDDDPFGLGTIQAKKASLRSDVVIESNEDDDVLGLLGRPVSEFQRKAAPVATQNAQVNGETLHPQDQAIAELVEMGFSLERSREALEATETGTDVQAAVGWLLNQAHQDSRNKTQAPQGSRSASQPTKERRRSSGSRTKSATPAWMRQGSGAPSEVNRQSSRSPANGEKDPAKIASEPGNNLFKTANSLWKTGTKKLNQAVAELNSDSDTNQPKWMRAANPEAEGRKSGSRRGSKDADDLDRQAVKAMREAKAQQKEADVTDEAMMLESQDSRPVRKPPTRPKGDDFVPSRDTSRMQSLTLAARRDRNMPQPKFLQQQTVHDPRARLNKQAVEEQASEAYISPARRKKPTPKPPIEQKQPPPEPEPDLLFGDSQPSRTQAATQRSRPPPPPSSRPATTNHLPTRPPPPKRTIPPLNPSALQSSNKARLAGTETFKRGDYAEATTHYSSALRALPPTHPLTIPILTNRSLSYSKTGDPKASIADADTALGIIGPSRGASESIDLGAEGSKDMFIFWGKAMTRRAESLEHLERWPDALAAWKACVEAGVGGATSIAGRNRCEKAVNPLAAKPPANKRPLPKAKPRPTALDDLAGRPTAQSAQSAEAVSRLRAANLEADRVDDEKFALSDSVSERLQSWRAGKEGNLRALLASLENVLWEGAGWKKIAMGELILPGKVKVQYMKGIAKVHPDKVSELFFVTGSTMGLRANGNALRR